MGSERLTYVPFQNTFAEVDFFFHLWKAVTQLMGLFWQIPASPAFASLNVLKGPPVLRVGGCSRKKEPDKACSTIRQPEENRIHSLVY